jgi:hypothetical protein
MTYSLVSLLDHSTTLGVPDVRAANHDQAHSADDLQNYLHRDRPHGLTAL